MGQINIGPKHHIFQKAVITNDVPLAAEPILIDNSLINRISDLEQQLFDAQNNTTIKEIIKEVPVEVIREIKVIEERIVEKQVIKEFPVFKETIVREFVDRPVTVFKEIDKEVIKYIKYIPTWVYGALAAQTVAIVILILK